MKKAWIRARRSAVFLLVLTLFCLWAGAFAYLCRQSVKEPFFSAEMQGQSLSWMLMGWEGRTSLTALNEAAGAVQKYWVLLPAPWRFTAQTAVKICIETQKTG